MEDAEEETREALNESTDGATDGDVLAVLLTVFKADRESAIHGEDSWDRPLEYCKRMCFLCDRNFLSAGGQPRVDDFPARVVASIYAESGRSFALAGQISSARDLLQKSLNVFLLISEPSMEEVLEISACRASLARVLRRAGNLKGAQDEFLQAMQLLADPLAGSCFFICSLLFWDFLRFWMFFLGCLKRKSKDVPDTFEVPGLVTEYAETLAAAGDDAVASQELLNLIIQRLGPGISTRSKWKASWKDWETLVERPNNKQIGGIARTSAVRIYSVQIIHSSLILVSDLALLCGYHWLPLWLCCDILVTKGRGGEVRRRERWALPSPAWAVWCMPHCWEVLFGCSHLHHSVEAFSCGAQNRINDKWRKHNIDVGCTYFLISAASSCFALNYELLRQLLAFPIYNIKDFVLGFANQSPIELFLKVVCSWQRSVITKA